MSALEGILNRPQIQSRHLQFLRLSMQSDHIMFVMKVELLITQDKIKQGKSKFYSDKKTTKWLQSWGIEQDLKVQAC
ncbi:hypothetical protein [Candidatus Nitrotoga sp. 1052]|uniref:hypothetical protein n=1 Tax=Candidatus Nitrotoga sp. 1052 TaxID=2886964 RepID=UPI001EF40487|nr:hypothetical protein [Candidatus Nitrotoga sp. 1052]CAH1079411.1 hypothetical protein NTG1052_350069 [Candidatus Nitrotoga sp. 1052]